MEKDVETIFNKLLSGMALPTIRYKEPFVLIMSGHVGSGKSTIAKVLSSELSAYIVGGDKIRNIYYSNKNANHDFNYINNITNAVNKMEVEYLLRNGVSVILDRSISSKKIMDILKKACNNIVSIKLNSNHEINIKRISNRKEYNIDALDCYGDVDSESGVTTEEVYNEILNRKLYDLEDSEFDYQIDATKSIDSVIVQAKEIAYIIKEKNQNNVDVINL